MKKGVFILPNLFTSANLALGFFAIIQTHKGHYDFAAMSIILALIFDALDGKIARITNTTSRFGIEYDSLADLVSFGAAPAFLAYAWALYHFERAGWVGGLVFCLCAALRLARR